jgi:hypothetical protein
VVDGELGVDSDTGVSRFFHQFGANQNLYLQADQPLYGVRDVLVRYVQKRASNGRNVFSSLYAVSWRWRCPQNFCRVNGDAHEPAAD